MRTVTQSLTSVTIEEQYNGYNISYQLNYTNESAPDVVLFNISKEDFGGISGSYHPNGNQMNINASGYETNMGALLDYVYDACLDIVVEYTPTV